MIREQRLNDVLVFRQRQIVLKHLIFKRRLHNHRLNCVRIKVAHQFARLNLTAQIDLGLFSVFAEVTLEQVHLELIKVIGEPVRVGIEEMVGEFLVEIISTNLRIP